MLAIGLNNLDSNRASEIETSPKKQAAMRFGLNPKTKIGGSNTGLLGGPMKGIHPQPFGHPFKRSNLNEQLNKKNEELSKMILPQIKQRKLDDLDSSENPFKVHKTTEKMLVFREKQREFEQLESIKHKIEHKYMYG